MQLLLLGNETKLEKVEIKAHLTFTIPSNLDQPQKILKQFVKV